MGTLEFFRLLSKSTSPASGVAFPDIYSLASNETCRGGYLITEDPESPVMILTEHLPLNSRFGGDSQHMTVSAPQALEAGQFYLIGGPGQPSCEVVRVEEEAVPGQPPRIKRRLFRTVGLVSHPVGTWVRRVTVERVFDWARCEQQAQK